LIEAAKTCFLKGFLAVLVEKIVASFLDINLQMA